MGFPRQEYWSGCHALLQGIFLTQGSNPGLLNCRQILYHLSHWGSPLSFHPLPVPSFPSFKVLVGKPFQLLQPEHSSPWFILDFVFFQGVFSSLSWYPAIHHILGLFCVGHWKGCDDYETLTLSLEGHRPQSGSKYRAPAAPRRGRSKTLTHKASKLHPTLCVEAFQSPLLLTQAISHGKLQDVLTGDKESQPSLKCHSLYQKLFCGLLSKSLI